MEKDLVLLELRGKETAGYYFSLTDARTATAPSEYKYLTQGIARTGPVRTVFTILQHEPSVADKEQALQIGVWDAIAFDEEMHRSDDIPSEIWAHHVQAETWIDLHLSVRSGQAREQSRATLLALLKTLEVREK